MNLQPVEKQDYDSDGALDVISIYRTIQGEGPYTGHPAVFVRLAGCDLQCALCDTDYTSNRMMMSVDDLVRQISSNQPDGLIVITGGEPFRQNLSLLVNTLWRRTYNIQIETNGTLYPKSKFPYDLVEIVCSPKTGLINNWLQPHIDHLKYVVEAGKTDPRDGLPTSCLGSDIRVARPWIGFLGNIYIQPVDEGDPVKNRANIDEAVRSCMKFGYILSLQIHKYLRLE